MNLLEKIKKIFIKEKEKTVYDDIIDDLHLYYSTILPKKRMFLYNHWTTLDLINKSAYSKDITYISYTHKYPEIYKHIDETLFFIIPITNDDKFINALIHGIDYTDAITRYCVEMKKKYEKDNDDTVVIIEVKNIKINPQ